MTPSPRRVREVLAAVRDRPPEERDEALAALAGDDGPLRDEVLSLLEASEAMGSFLSRDAAGILEVNLPRPLGPGDRIGRFEIVRIVGTGGTGTVYEAQQTSPSRRVAIKVLRLEARDAERRLRDEAEILARFRHPFVAHVYEAGTYDGLPYIALEFVEGARTITEHVVRADLDRRSRLRLFVRICDAVHHGHEKGIIHRDVKPGNVLVDAAGHVRLIDFGIASVADVSRAEEGTLRGTLPYMSPEACVPGGGDVDVRSDVYSLGVLLFEMLTGDLPVPTGDVPVSEALRRVRERPPRWLGAAGRSIGRDLEAIVDKALAKDRTERYPSAAGLAEDVQRHLGGRAVEARAGGLLYQLSRLARRHRAGAVAIVLVVALTLASALVNRRLANEARRAAVEARDERAEADFQAYVANIAAAAFAIRANDVAEASLRLDRAPPALRGWEWRHLRARLDDAAGELARVGGPLRQGAVSADGHTVAATLAGLVLVWRDGKEVGRFPTTETYPFSLALRPDGTRLAIGYRSGRVVLREVDGGRTLASRAIHDDMVTALRFAPGGRLVSASADRSIRILDDGDLSRRGELAGHPDRVIALAVDAPRNRLLSGGREGSVRLWDLGSGARLRTLVGHRFSVDSVAVSPDGRRAVSGSRDRTTRLWDLETGRQLAVGTTHESNVAAVAFAGDGATYASASWDRTIRIHDTATGAEVACLRGHTAPPRDLAVRPDPPRLVSFAMDGSVKLWRLGPHEDVATLRGHEDLVREVAFGEDGALVSACLDGTIRRWDPARRQETARAEAAADEGILDLAIDRRRDRVYAATRTDRILVRSGPDLVPAPPLVAEGLSMTAVAVAPESGRVLAGSRTGDLIVWDAPTGRLLLRRPGARPAPVAGLAVTRDGTVVALDSTGTVKLLRLDDLRILREARIPTVGIPGALAVSADGAFLAIGAREVILVDVSTLKPLGRMTGHAERVTSLAFSPDGARLASGGQEGTIRLWHVERRRQVAVLRGHRYPVWAVAFSPDGATIASGAGTYEGVECTVKLWETRPGDR